ncbi:tRNA pseudouridine(13) synthase TruD [Echinimonas agarilytica]|uniref:tRNA pseudouridine synthase D n=1 Tax=Echinimonas agarilytica TaxID=1215918 RepID=A0AA41W4L6_9GAMM|nr:tRNA pseudouridine(13) synthase TruD [Echinimonas agarilytica]MCM2678837.1 tRNA pseudouridine(13) synthase TruD [Echinimonas agarilytica]
MMNQFSYRFGQPEHTAHIRTEPADFKVQEMIRVQPDGEGEHVWMNIRKQGMNTQFLAKRLAKWAGVPEKQVSYAGLKDRHAVTEQWFSVQMPGRETPDVELLNDEEVIVLSAQRHSQKLRSAVLAANRFELRLRNVSDVASVEQRWHSIVQGVPNYFGEQRFGINGGNIAKAERMFAGQRVKRPLQSIYISSVRSLMFNEIVSRRLDQGIFDRLIPGDIMMLSGSNSTFEQKGEDDLVDRLNSGDIQLTAPLWGEGRDPLVADYAELVAEVTSKHPTLIEGLKSVRARLAFRPIQLKPESCSINAEGNDIVVGFVLPSGSFATSILRELVDYKDISGEALHAHSD